MAEQPSPKRQRTTDSPTGISENTASLTLTAACAVEGNTEPSRDSSAAVDLLSVEQGTDEEDEGTQTDLVDDSDCQEDVRSVDSEGAGSIADFVKPDSDPVETVETGPVIDPSAILPEGMRRQRRAPQRFTAIALTADILLADVPPEEYAAALAEEVSSVGSHHTSEDSDYNNSEDEEDTGDNFSDDDDSEDEDEDEDDDDDDEL
jgi:hypothetical protein